MTRRDALIIGLVTIIGSAFMFCYVSGFNKTVTFWTAIVTVVVLAICGFIGYKNGIFGRGEN